MTPRQSAAFVSTTVPGNAQEPGADVAHAIPVPAIWGFCHSRCWRSQELNLDTDPSIQHKHAQTTFGRIDGDAIAGEQDGLEESAALQVHDQQMPNAIMVVDGILTLITARERLGLVEFFPSLAAHLSADPDAFDEPRETPASQLIHFRAPTPLAMRFSTLLGIALHTASVLGAAIPEGVVQRDFYDCMCPMYMGDSHRRCMERCREQYYSRVSFVDAPKTLAPAAASAGVGFHFHVRVNFDLDVCSYHVFYFDGDVYFCVHYFLDFNFRHQFPNFYHCYRFLVYFNSVDFYYCHKHKFAYFDFDFDFYYPHEFPVINFDVDFYRLILFNFDFNFRYWLVHLYWLVFYWLVHLHHRFVDLHYRHIYLSYQLIDFHHCYNPLIYVDFNFESHHDCHFSIDFHQRASFRRHAPPVTVTATVTATAATTTVTATVTQAPPGAGFPDPFNPFPIGGDGPFRGKRRNVAEAKH
ncbi:hypothetical protein CPLU01_10355 [Colletotrichum plurivorum]|uniref:Uncharacterized protein n=1 Tax=Colletotrichum plurivorum TaxID=2175906 RepID=A0A8H6K6V2_9PEZI|nr:hypothetical protein CPLU01_10355 [Colletotrichum plurivorum]